MQDHFRHIRNQQTASRVRDFDLALVNPHWGETFTALRSGHSRQTNTRSFSLPLYVAEPGEGSKASSEYVRCSCSHSASFPRERASWGEKWWSQTAWDEGMVWCFSHQTSDIRHQTSGWIQEPAPLDRIAEFRKGGTGRPSEPELAGFWNVETWIE
jgi:hypothetical protein